MLSAQLVVVHRGGALLGGRVDKLGGDLAVREVLQIAIHVAVQTLLELLVVDVPTTECVEQLQIAGGIRGRALVCGLRGARGALAGQLFASRLQLIGSTQLKVLHRLVRHM